MASAIILFYTVVSMLMSVCMTASSKDTIRIWDKIHLIKEEILLDSKTDQRSRITMSTFTADAMCKLCDAIQNRSRKMLCRRRLCNRVKIVNDR